MNQLNKTKVNWLENTLKFGVFLLPFSADFGATALGIVLVGLWRQKYKKIISNPINRGWGLLFIWLITTSLFAVYSRYSWEGLGNFLPSFLMIASFPFFFQDFLQLYQLAWWFVLTSIPVCFLGFMQLLFGWQTPLFLHSFGLKMTAYGHPDGRMSSLLMYANTLAFFLVVAFTLSIGLWILHYRRRSLQKDSWINWQLSILTVGILFNGIGLILTNSRSAWGLALLGLIAFAIYLRWYWIIATVLLIIFLVAWAAWIPVYQDVMRQVVPSYFWARLTDEMYDDRYVTALRTTQWGVAWDMMLQRPLWGWGLRNFTPVYQEKMNVWMGHPHNLFLMLLAEIGAIGTLLFSGLVGTILAKVVILMAKIKKNIQNIFAYSEEYFLLLFTYLLAFVLCIIFNLLDVSIFDLRVNLIGWLLLSALAGIANYQSLSRDHINEITFKK
ncbi:O-antigen ligase family protein [Crocosphaera sp.]|uniref:O-antigen ligase family protein n=1 Tax=Crocosphaera sp. TaxID=2729996 RepID=UPI0026299201|nr:O-antigen ligase family protein [Crocosphaera sp.]MDJ0582007.1 O-antigen ligase family protein [Crocosphaera sp.]